MKCKWVASLSNGATAIEGTAPFEIIAGELSPWLRLRQYLQDTGFHITGMRVQVSKSGKPTHTYNMPSMHATPDGSHPRWAKLVPRIPINFNYMRAAGQILTPTGEYQQRDILIAAEYDDFIVFLGIDETDGNESWIVIHDKIQVRNSRS